MRLSEAGSAILPVPAIRNDGPGEREMYRETSIGISTMAVDSKYGMVVVSSRSGSEVVIDDEGAGME